MGVPMIDSRSEILIRGPHVSKTDTVSSWKVPFDVGCLNAFGNLLRSLPLQRKLGSQFVIGHHHASRWRTETDRRANGWIIDDLTELRRGVCWRREPAHDHAHKTVVTIVNGLEAGRRQDLYRRVTGNVVRSRALRQRNFDVSSHHVLAERRILGTLRPQRARVQSRKQKNQTDRKLFHFK